LTGQKHGLLCVSADARPLTPLVSWQDQRTAEPWPGGSTSLEQIHERLDGLDWYENGCRIQHGFGAATLFWLVQSGQLPAGVERACTIADWLAGQLTGRLPVTDPTLAASWGIYNLVGGAWHAAFCERLVLAARLLPPVLPSGQLLGGLRRTVVGEVALPQGLPVFNALGDTQASFLGAVLSPGPSAQGRSPHRDLTGDKLDQVVFLIDPNLLN
jgi:sugar (pentulose or hexulose) kinase